MWVNERSFQMIHGWWFYFWPKHLDFEYVSTCLNNLHPAIKYMFEKAKLI